MYKKKLLFLIDISSYLLSKYKNLYNFKIFKYGKYILLIAIIYYLSKKFVKNRFNKILKNLISPNEEISTPFTNKILDYPSKNYKIKEIAKYEIANKILKELDKEPELKEEFLLHKPEINIIDVSLNSKESTLNNRKSINFTIETKNFSQELKNKLLNIDMFGLAKICIENIHNFDGFYIIDNNKLIYEVEVENNLDRIYQTKEFKDNEASGFRCPIVASEHGIINHYLQLKINKYINLIEKLYNNLDLFSKFLDEFTTDNKKIKNEKINDLLKNLISTYDFTEQFSYKTKILEDKLITSFKNKNLKLANKKNITDDEMNQQIQLIFDKLTNIFHIYNPDKINILKHIGTIFVIEWIWQIFNYYLYSNKLSLLPEIKVNAPIISPRFWCTLDPLNTNIHLKYLGHHFHFSYFTLDKDYANKVKKCIEEWVKKYYINKNPTLWSDKLDASKITHFKVVLREYNN